MHANKSKSKIKSSNFRLLAMRILIEHSEFLATWIFYCVDRWSADEFSLRGLDKLTPSVSSPEPSSVCSTFALRQRNQKLCTRVRTPVVLILIEISSITPDWSSSLRHPVDFVYVSETWATISIQCSQIEWQVICCMQFASVDVAVLGPSSAGGGTAHCDL